MRERKTIVVLGLSLSSSWGNGHATTWRALLRGVAAEGHRVVFLERDVPWYASHRDLPDPDFCELVLYQSLDDLDAHAPLLRGADAVIVGSYVPDGPAVIDRVVETARGVVAFYDIDTPVTLAGLARGETTSLEPRQIPLFDVYFSFTGGPTLDVLETRWGARAARALYCSVEADRYAPTGEAPVWDLGYLGTYAPDRQPALQRLLIEPAWRLPHRRFVVAGPQYPDDIVWPENVERIAHLPPAEHPSFYARQRFTLNVTRADMVAAGWSPSVRLFEAAACGTAIVGDDWAGLDTLLPDGEAMCVAHTSEDVVAALETMPDDARHAMAEEARRLILADHTGRARARELVAGLDEARARRHDADREKRIAIG